MSKWKLRAALALGLAFAGCEKPKPRPVEPAKPVRTAPEPTRAEEPVRVPGLPKPKPAEEKKRPPAEKAREPVKRAVETRMLCDFETENELGMWALGGSTAELTSDPEAATHGRRAARVTLGTEATWPGMIAGRFEGEKPRLNCDWSGYDWLRVDMYNPTEEPINLGVRIDDLDSKNYSTRYNPEEPLSLRPGMNTFEIPVYALQTVDPQNPRMLDPKRIKALIFSMHNLKKPVTFYVDHLRLERAEKLRMEGIHAFDFGSAGSPLADGFTRVTPRSAYTDAAGFGWTSTEGLQSGGNDRGHPDPLMCDFVSGNRYLRYKLPFAVKVPDGTHTVWCLARNVTEDGPAVPAKSFAVVAEGKTRYSFELDGERFLGREHLFYGIDDEFDPERDVWKRYVHDFAPPVSFDVEVRDGRLDVVFDTCVAYSLLVFPKGSEDGRKFLNSVEDMRRKKFYGKHFWMKRPRAAEPEAADKWRALGYVVFHRPHMKEVGAFDVPSPEEIISDGLTVEVARGEYEPVTFSVRPLVELGALGIEVTDLAGPKGLCPSSNIKVRYVRNVLREYGSGLYRPAPTVLMPAGAVPVKKGLTRRIWLTVRVPRNLAPGDYTGGVRLVPERGGRPFGIPLRVRVRPYALEEGEVTFAWYYADPGGLNYYTRYFPELAGRHGSILDAEYADMKRHGSNACTIPLPGLLARGDEAQLDFRALVPHIEMSKKHGLNTTFPGQIHIHGFARRLPRYGIQRWTPRFNAVYKDAVGRLDRYLKEQGVDFVMWVTDEPRERNLNPWNENFENTMKLLKLCREVEGVRTTVTPMGDSQSGVDYLPMLDWMDIVQTHPTPGSRKMIEIARKGKPVYWIYNASIDRLSWGFYVWARGARGRWQWHYDFKSCAWNPIFARAVEATWPSPEGPLPTIGYELTREGIDDYRYLFTLERRIAKARAAGGRAAELAEEAATKLDHLRRLVPEFHGHGIVDGTEVGEAYKGPINDLLDVWRKEVAERIEKIDAALRQ